MIKNGFTGTIGNTPLIRLNKLSDLLGCEILAKAEFLNPGGSVKDRAALSIIQDAESKGLLKPGGTIIEGTAGNTGIGLTLVAAAKGYKSIIVMPNSQSREKFELLRALGAKVIGVDSEPFPGPKNFNIVAKKLAEETPGSYWANQFDNTANRNAHFTTTGPEIWKQTSEKITCFVSVVGSGGTISGTSDYLKSVNPKVRTVLADPFGAAIYSWIKNGHLNDDEGDSITEGIGQNRITKNLENAPIDDAFRIGDPVIIEMMYWLLRNEGLFLGSSSALNVCGAVKQAKLGGKGQTIVTVLCDGGGRYISKLYNPSWLAEQELTPKAKGLEFLDLL